MLSFTMLVGVITMFGLSTSLTIAYVLMLRHLKRLSQKEVRFPISIGVMAVAAWAVTIPSIIHYWNTIV